MGTIWEKVRSGHEYSVSNTGRVRRIGANEDKATIQKKCSQ